MMKYYKCSYCNGNPCIIVMNEEDDFPYFCPYGKDGKVDWKEITKEEFDNENK